MKANLRQFIFWLILILIVFFIGYYLRAYLSIYTDLPLSPYEAFKNGGNLSWPVEDDFFSVKDVAYPASYILARILKPFIGEFYIIYLLGAVIIYLLGKEISGSKLGGFFAFFIFAVSSENLLQYTGKIYPSSLCYVSIWAALFFLFRYFSNKRDINILFFILSGVVVITSYHTGAGAFLLIILGLLISQIISKIQIDKKVISSFLFLGLIYGLWVLIFDFNQFDLVSSSFYSFFFNFSWHKLWPFIFVFAMISALFVLANIKPKYFNLLPLFAIGLSSIIIFLPFDFFGRFLIFGAPYYYISPVTLNNYMGQIILTHVYLILFFRGIFERREDQKSIFLFGWALGIFFIFIILILETYYARIFDYSFPLMFILFGFWWSNNKRFRNFVVSVTIILLVVSQLIIYRDPFTMRRYYNQEEINSVQNVINLNLDGIFNSDLRTAALFDYLGKNDVNFFMSDSQEFRLMFYDYPDYKKYDLPTSTSIYIIISKSMKNILYSTNFEVRPIDDDIFSFYDQEMIKIYDDDILKVYKVNTTTLGF